MAKLSWPDMMAIRPRAHLVAVTLPEVEQLGPDLRNARSTLTRFLRQQLPDVVLGSSIVRTVGDPEIHFAFPVETDARRFADELGAGVVTRYPGWASQRAGTVTVKKLADIGASLALPKSSGRPIG